MAVVKGQLDTRIGLAALILCIVLYGVYATLAGICIHFLVKNRHKTRAQRIILTYTIIMFAVSTVYSTTAAMSFQVKLIERLIDSKTDSDLLAAEFQLAAMCESAALVMNVWLADSLITYRVFIVYDGRYNIIILPVILWLSSVGTGVFALYIAITDGGPLVSILPLLEIIFFSLSISLNVLATTLITGKLWLQRRRIAQFADFNATKYSYAIAVLIESAALYTTARVIYIPLTALKVPVAPDFSVVIGAATMIAPTLIVLRVALGRAATATTIDGSVRRGGDIELPVLAFRTQQSGPAVDPPAIEAEIFHTVPCVASAVTSLADDNAGSVRDEGDRKCGGPIVLV